MRFVVQVMSNIVADRVGFRLGADNLFASLFNHFLAHGPQIVRLSNGRHRIDEHGGKVEAPSHFTCLVVERKRVMVVVKSFTYKWQRDICPENSEKDRNNNNLPSAPNETKTFSRGRSRSSYGWSPHM